MFISLLATAPQIGRIAYGEGLDIPWLRIILALVFCLFLATAAIVLIRARKGMPIVPAEIAKRFRVSDADTRASIDQNIRIAQRLAVTPSSQLVVIKRGQLNYLLHLTDVGATEIDRYCDEEESQTKGHKE